MERKYRNAYYTGLIASCLYCLYLLINEGIESAIPIVCIFTFMNLAFFITKEN